MSSETDNLERQAELKRARLADTAETLRSRMTPGQIIDEFTSAFRGGDGSIALNNLKTQVRDNPLPLALMGTGLAWLLLGKGGGADASGHSRSAYASAAGSTSTYTGSQGHDEADDEAGPSLTERAKSAVSGAMDAGTEAMQSAVDTVSDTLGMGGDAAGRAASSAYHSGRAAMHGAAKQFEGMPRVMSDLLQREPLVTAAVGVALGLALGTLLPHSEIEDKHLGAASDDLKRQAKDLATKGMDEAKAIVSEGYDALKEAANEEGLTSGEKPVAERIGSVLKSAVEAGESALQDRFRDEKA